MAPPLARGVADPFEGVAEGAVPDIVEQRRQHGDSGALFVELAADFASNRFDQLARGMKDADAVGEPRVCRAGEHEIRKTQLAYVAQSLKFPSVDQPPGELIDLVRGAEDDQPVNRIPDTLCLSVTHDSRMFS